MSKWLQLIMFYNIFWTWTFELLLQQSPNNSQWVSNVHNRTNTNCNSDILRSPLKKTKIIPHTCHC